MNLHPPENEKQPSAEDLEASPDPVDADGWFKRGLSFAQLGIPDKAADAFQQAAWLEPDNVNVQFNMGTAHLSMGMFEQAIISFTKTIELSPEMPDAYGNRAVAHTALGDDERADADVARAIELGAPPDGLGAVLDYVKQRRKPK